MAEKEREDGGRAGHILVAKRKCQAFHPERLSEIIDAEARNAGKPDAFFHAAAGRRDGDIDMGEMFLDCTNTPREMRGMGRPGMAGADVVNGDICDRQTGQERWMDETRNLL